MIIQAQSNYIVDRYFFECLRKVEQSSKKKSNSSLFRALLLLISLPINHIVFEQQKQPLSLFSIFLMSATAYCLAQFLSQMYFSCTRLKNTRQILRIAAEIHHVYQTSELKSSDRVDNEDEITHFDTQLYQGLKISTQYYDFQNMEKVADVTEQNKQAREESGRKLINTTLKGTIFLSKPFMWLMQLASVGLFMFGLTLSSKDQLKEPQHTLLQLFLITQVLLKPKVYAIIFIICMLPFICILYCLWICVCKKGQAPVRLPSKQRATTQLLSKCSECSICFQEFAIGQEDLVVLPCSQLHIFHHTCIEGWTKVKSNCPICRNQL